MGWINGGSHVCIMLYRENWGWITFLHSVIWGGIRMDYIFELLYMGWIRGGLHFCILLYGED